MAGTGASSSSNDGPVLNLMNKRLRALRKKLNRISRMEESLVQGKSLNKEQAQALSSKSEVVARIDELERLLQPLPEAINLETKIALEKNKKISEPQCEDKRDSEENGKPDANKEICGVSDLLNLVYFGSLFNVQTLMAVNENMLIRSHERNLCLSYDYVTDDASVEDLLKESDLDLITSMGSLVISRSVNSRLSHKYTLEKCVEHARLWIANSDQHIQPHSSVTYAGLRVKLDKIMASEYFTTSPQINFIEVANFFNNYTSFKCIEDESMIPQVDFHVSMEDLSEESEEDVPSYNYLHDSHGFFCR